MPEASHKTFVVPTAGRTPALTVPASDALRTRRMFWTAAPAGSVRAGVDNGPVHETLGLEEMAAALGQPRDDAPEHVAESERITLDGVEAMRVRSSWEERGIAWRRVDIVWMTGDTWWNAWAIAPAAFAASGALSLDELVLRNAEAASGRPEPPLDRWESAIDAWGRVTV